MQCLQLSSLLLRFDLAAAAVCIRSSQHRRLVLHGCKRRVACETPQLKDVAHYKCCTRRFHAPSSHDTLKRYQAYHLIPLTTLSAPRLALTGPKGLIYFHCIPHCTRQTLRSCYCCPPPAKRPPSAMNWLLRASVVVAAVHCAMATHFRCVWLMCTV